MISSFAKRNEIVKIELKKDYFKSIEWSTIIFDSKIPPAKIKSFPLNLYYSLIVTQTKKSTSLLKPVDEKLSKSRVLFL